MISNFPEALRPVIQQGFLARSTEQALRSIQSFRAIADRESISVKVGETVTKTRVGLKPTAKTPINPASNTNLDNGLTPSGYGVEQYTLGMNMHGDTMDLNVVTSQVGIVRQFVQNGIANANQAARTLDELARDALYAVYLGGNTRTSGASADAQVEVDDVRGFNVVHVNGVPTAVSPAAPMTVAFGADIRDVIGVLADAVNTSTTPGGRSGKLILGSALDVPAGLPVVAATAPSIIRANARATSADLVGGDRLTMGLLLDGKAILEGNGVPRVDGFYHCHLDNFSARQLFADADFKTLFQGATAESAAYRRGELADPFLGLRFIPSTEVPTEKRGAVTVRRPIICGQGALVEGTFDGMATSPIAQNAIVDVVDDIAFVTRPSLDRLAQIIAQSWYWMGGYAAPSDTTTSPTTVGTATNAAFKRAVVLEHA